MKDRFDGTSIPRSEVTPRFVSQMLNWYRDSHPPPPGNGGTTPKDITQDEQNKADAVEPPDAPVPLWLQIGRGLIDPVRLPWHFITNVTQGGDSPRMGSHSDPDAGLMESLRGTVVRNEQTGDAILIDRKGARESVSRVRRPEELNALAKIEEIIAKSKYIGSEPDQKGHVDIKAWHEYETSVQIDGKDHTVTIKVRELKNGLRFYDSYILNK